MKVVTIKNHNVDGSHHYKVGDVYEVTDRTANFLASLGYVQLAAEPLEIVFDDKKRYKRRDLRSEP